MSISRLSVLLAVTVAILLAALITKCPRTDDTSSTAKPTSTPATSPTPEPTVLPDITFPPNVGDAFEPAEFPYTCNKDGKKIVATFDKELVPRDANVVAGAIRDVIGRCFNDRADSAPRLTGTGPAQVIRINGKKHGYIVVPISEGTGELHSLVITQVTD